MNQVPATSKVKLDLFGNVKVKEQKLVIRVAWADLCWVFFKSNIKSSRFFTSGISGPDSKKAYDRVEFSRSRTDQLTKCLFAIFQVKFITYFVFLFGRQKTCWNELATLLLNDAKPVIDLYEYHLLTDTLVSLNISCTELWDNVHYFPQIWN